MIKAQIVADSLDPRGNRLTSMLITFPRFILAELNTHRMLSKNSASSRAIPFNKMVESVQSNPFIPIAWQKEHTGMQGSEYIVNVDDINYNIDNWLQARDYALDQAKYLTTNGVTKQLANRLLEPFMWHTVLISGTEWENFFELRCPQYEVQVGATGRQYFRSRKELANRYPDQVPEDELGWMHINKGQAEIHMMALAEAMWDAMNESVPKELEAGEWHIPFEDKIRVPYILVGEFGDFHKSLLEEKVKISTAMCARTSYTVVGDEKKFTYEQQIALHDRMANAVPFHASPMEHCARVMTDWEYQSFVRGNVLPIDDETNFREKQSEGWCRNYKGFIQYREILENK